MKKITGYSWGIIGALFIGFLLRFWQVGSLPVILNRDEAALAYNALLLKETGKDEWGRAWPLALESFGDYKLPGYVWSLIPFFTIFGYADWVVRLPSVLAGTLLILAVYAWLKELKLSPLFSLLGAWLIALLPVSLFFSRMAYEANIGLTLFVASLWLITALRNNWKWSLVALLSVFLMFGIFTYNTPWLLLPFLTVYTFLLFIPKNISKAFTLMIIMALIFLIGAYFLLPLTAQKKGITLFQDETVWSQWILYRENLSPQLVPILGSKYVYWVELIWQRFWQSFTPSFLVTHGDNHEWHRLPTWGHTNWLIYGAGLGGILFSLLQVIRHKLQKKDDLALLFLLVTSLAPSVITVDAPHATRSLLFFVLWVVFAVKGLKELWGWQHWNKKVLPWSLLILVILGESIWHSYQLFGVYPQNQAMFKPGFDQVIQSLEKKYPGETVAIVDPSGYHYILTAWYLKMKPESYFQTTIRQLPDKIGFRYGEKTAHYHFIAQPSDRVSSEKVLVQWSSKEEAWKIEEGL